MDHQHQPNVSRSQSAKNGRRLILSVDDEPAILVTRQKILEGAGYDVLSATDGEQALRLFASQPVDLVLLDYVLPGLGGGAIAEQMKRCRHNVPIVLVTASPVPEETVTRVDCRIVKGEGPALLLEKIAQFLVPLSTRNPASRSVSRSPERRQMELRNRKKLSRNRWG
jgi:CheY-like chemotaxis protein